MLLSCDIKNLTVCPHRRDVSINSYEVKSCLGTPLLFKTYHFSIEYIERKISMILLLINSISRFNGTKFTKHFL